MPRSTRRMKASLKPVADADSQTDSAAQPDGLPLQAYVQGVKGPDGRWWVSLQLQQGSLALASAIPPENVEHFLSVVGRDMRAQAASCRQQNGGTAQRSGLIVAGPQDVPRFPTS